MVPALTPLRAPGGVYLHPPCPGEPLVSPSPPPATCRGLGGPQAATPTAGTWPRAGVARDRPPWCWEPHVAGAEQPTLWAGRGPLPRPEQLRWPLFFQVELKTARGQDPQNKVWDSS